MFLLDTNVLSEVVKPVPDDKVLNWLANIDEDRLFLSVISFAEMHRGICLMSAGKKRNALARWLEQDLLPRFDQRILPVDTKIALAWGRLMGAAKQSGFALSSMDGLIAATAMMTDRVLVTRNTKDFDFLTIKIFNPWEDAPV